MSRDHSILRGRALEAALKAKGGALDPKEVEALWLRANRVLERDDPFFAAIQEFVTLFPVRRFTPQLVSLGDDLADAVIAAQPAPNIAPQSAIKIDHWQDRKDING
ncbi:hypothetical protein [Roseobacter sp. TSBP12]|uniref:hypothetical protein n=1 Tax=Roseobacter sp. TSBP12 TaxID=1236613 RepID=UPI00125EFFD1|nr:hypothetical protein [Roseobacter sp. TSBP12]KAB6717735.1 hypothetical protein C8029_04235 [Roseobacter sp. TSBP12]